MNSLFKLIDVENIVPLCEMNDFLTVEEVNDEFVEYIQILRNWRCRAEESVPAVPNREDVQSPRFEDPANFSEKRFNVGPCQCHAKEQVRITGIEGGIIKRECVPDVMVNSSDQVGEPGCLRSLPDLCQPRSAVINGCYGESEAGKMDGITSLTGAQLENPLDILSLKERSRSDGRFAGIFPENIAIFGEGLFPEIHLLIEDFIHGPISIVPESPTL